MDFFLTGLPYPIPQLSGGYRDSDLCPWYDLLMLGVGVSHMDLILKTFWLCGLTKFSVSLRDWCRDRLLLDPILWSGAAF